MSGPSLMKVFVQWVTQRRYRLVLVAIAFAPFLPVISTALLALETIRLGGLTASTSALAAAGGIITLGALSTSEIGTFTVLGTATANAGWPGARGSVTLVLVPCRTCGADMT